MSVLGPRPASLSPDDTLLFICDIQTKFEKAIHGFSSVVASTNKMIHIARIMNIPVVVTEQNPQALGPTFPSIDLAALENLYLGTFSKSLFSMITPGVEAILVARPQIRNIILVGIESHVCVLQTALDLLTRGCAVHVLADAVSSCNHAEVPIALARISQAGGFVSTTESVSFMLQRDAGGQDFKPFSAIIKKEIVSTKEVLQTLLNPNTKSLL